MVNDNPAIPPKGIKAKLDRFVSNFKALPIESKRLLSLGLVLALVFALPVLILTIISTRTYYFNRAATGETIEPPFYTPAPTSTPVPPAAGCNSRCNESIFPAIVCPGDLTCYQSSQKVGASGICRNPRCSSDADCICGSVVTPVPSARPTSTSRPTPTPIGNLINWSTSRVQLSASSLTINIDGYKNFYGNNSTLTLHSDPGSQTYTTLEAEWQENGVPMRLYMYFKRDLTTNKWQVSEIRTYDGSARGEWLYFSGLMWLPVGTPYFSGDMLYRSSNNRATIHFKDLYILPNFSSNPQPPPTVRPFNILLKLQGVTDDRADFQKLGNNFAKVVAKFVSPSLGFVPGYFTPPIGVDYVDNGIYSLRFGVWSSNLPAAGDYSIILKGEKHVATKFCQSSKQTKHCSGTGQISLPSDPLTTITLDFTGIPLQPGDVYPQDGIADINDFTKVAQLLTKPCSTLTVQDKLVGDLDYSGCVTVKDVFLIRQTLQTRYDEN